MEASVKKLLVYVPILEQLAINCPDARRTADFSICANCIRPFKNVSDQFRRNDLKWLEYDELFRERGIAADPDALTSALPTADESLCRAAMTFMTERFPLRDPRFDRVAFCHVFLAALRRLADLYDLKIDD